MPPTILAAIAPELRDDEDERLTLIPDRDDVPLSLTDGYGDFACGHCDLVLLHGELASRLDEDRVVEADAQELLVRCPGCGWDNAVPRG